MSDPQAPLPLPTPASHVPAEVSSAAPKPDAAPLKEGAVPSSRFRRKTVSRLIFESVLIVFSVLLALVLNEIRTHFASRSVHVETLRNLRTEIERNADIIANRYLPLHTRILEKLESISDQPDQIAELKKTGLSHVDLLPNESWVPELLHDTAWNVANSSASVLSYDERFALTRVYSAQNDGVRQTIDRLQDLLLSEDFADPARAEAKLRQLQIVMRELVSQEKSLLVSTYSDALGHDRLWTALK